MMKIIILLVFSLFIGITNAQQLEWATISGNTETDVSNSIFIDNNGNTYSTGYFGGTVDFDPGLGVYDLTSTGLKDAFVLKLDAAGEFVWAKSIGSLGDVIGHSIAVGGSIGDEIFIGGTFADVADFDPGPGQNEITSQGLNDGFILKLNDIGDFQWVKNYGSAGNEAVFSLKINEIYELYATGQFENTVDFNPLQTPIDLVANGAGSDAFVIKQDFNGNMIWATKFGSAQYEKGTSIAYDSEQNVIVSGEFQGTTDFDPSVAIFNLTSEGASDVFVSKFDTDGNFIWAKSIGGATDDLNPSIEVSTLADNTIYVTGSFEGTLDFDPGAGVEPKTSIAGHDIYVLSLMDNGDFSAVETYGGTGNDYGNSIDLSTSNELYVTGTYENIIDFDNTPGTYKLYTVGQSDIFALKLNASTLSTSWAKSFGSGNQEAGNSIVVDNANNVYVSGYIEGPTDFDPFSGSTILVPIGSFDAFTMKLTPCSPVSFTDTHTSCGPFTWTDGLEYTSSTINATQVLESSTGCDSIVTLNLTVFPIPTTFAGADLSVCTGENITLIGSGTATSYTWTNIADASIPIDGVAFTATSAGSYSYECVGTDANSCSNKDTITVSVYPLPTFTVTPTNVSTCFGGNNGFLSIEGLDSGADYQVEYTGSNSGYFNLGLLTADEGGAIFIMSLSAESFSSIIITSQSSGCQGNLTGPVIINEPTQISIIQQTDIIECADFGQITINAIATGGTGALTYLLDNGITDGVAFTPTIGLTAYNLTVIDQNSCTQTGLFQNLSIEANPTFTLNSTHPTTCLGTDGSITLTGLTPSTTYDVSYQKDNGVTGVGPAAMTSNATGEIIISSLEANTYDAFTVNSPTGCIGDDFTTVITLVDPNAPTISPGSDQTICEGTNITLSATVSSGSITWDNGVIDGSPFTPIATATYTATVSEFGCTASDMITVTLTPLDDASFNYTSNSYCLNASNQLPISIASAGGTFSGMTSVNSITGEIDISNTSLGMGNIIYTTNGICPNNSSLNIQFNDLPIIATIDSAICLNNGNLVLDGLATPVGGTFTGQHIENNVFTTNASIASSYIYNYSFTDVNGCSAGQSGIITVNSIPEINLAITNSNCSNNSGAVDATVTGGLSPYSVVWSTGQITEDITDLSPNNYYINVTDNNLCYVMEVATIASTEITLSGTITNNLCSGDQNGSINLSVNGTAGPYIYYWSNGETTEDISNLSAGQYEVFVTDVTNCTSTMSFIVTEPINISVNLSSTNTATCGAMDGNITSTITGGTPTYTFTWLDNSNTTIGTNQDLTSAGGGIYNLVIEDANGCTFTTTSSISENNSALITLNQNTNATCANDGSIDVNVTSSVAIQSYLWSSGEITEDISSLSPNVYSLTVTDINGCQASFTSTVNPVLPEPTNICVVTVDTATNTNLIVWEKPITTEIAYYVIYRETSVANEFLPVDTVNYDDLSQFTDPIAYPQIRSWRYKIKSVNTCGYSSNFGDIHKTIHVTISTGLAGSFNLHWDEYEGFTYPTFDVWRHTDTDGWGTFPIQSLPSNQFSYTDTPPSIDGLDYIIEITPPSVCTSTNKAIDHNSSRSNKSSSTSTPPGGNNTNSINEKSDFEIGIYPNPSHGQFNISLNDNTPKSMKVYDMKGSVVLEFNSSTKSIQLDLSKYENGMYILEVYSNNSVIRKQLLKQ